MNVKFDLNIGHGIVIEIWMTKLKCSYMRLNLSNTVKLIETLFLILASLAHRDGLNNKIL